MSFVELDEEKKTAQAIANHQSVAKPRKKRVASEEGKELNEKPGEESDHRTGRWTEAETTYVDELIANFETGTIPVADGIKLNDFLATMLLCKQSRLTKKMKNAKLGSRSFKRSTGCIADINDAREFSGLEEAFFNSIQCGKERAEMKFHMQRQWREMFTHYCARIGQFLDADAWLNSVEEIERRASIATVAARMKRRKLMITNALQQDGQSPECGVIIDHSDLMFGSSVDDFVLDSYDDYKHIFDGFHTGAPDVIDDNVNGRYVSPYLDKVMKYLERCNVPFEHFDAWVPSFVPASTADCSSAESKPKCRLCFAGCATGQIDSSNRREPMSQEDHFNLVSFGKYSERFSFEIGCGLPGRLYQSGVPTWDQNIQNAPHKYFERIVGAMQCNIRTVVGLPVRDLYHRRVRFFAHL